MKKFAVWMMVMIMGLSMVSAYADEGDISSVFYGFIDGEFKSESYSAHYENFECSYADGGCEDFNGFIKKFAEEVMTTYDIGENVVSYDMFDDSNAILTTTTWGDRGIVYVIITIRTY